MAPLQWKDEFSTGDAGVDAEHRELIDLVNAAAAAIRERRPLAEIDGHLGDLLRAITAHFAHEEHQMREARYDQTAEHKADHERLLDALRDIMDEVEDAAAEQAEGAAARLTAVLEDWFTGHARTHDARLHDRLGPHAH